MLTLSPESRMARADIFSGMQLLNHYSHLLGRFTKLGIFRPCYPYPTSTWGLPFKLISHKYYGCSGYENSSIEVGGDLVPEVITVFRTGRKFTR
jgi:hypothetical protein